MQYNLFCKLQHQKKIVIQAAIFCTTRNKQKVGGKISSLNSRIFIFNSPKNNRTASISARRSTTITSKARVEPSFG